MTTPATSVVIVSRDRPALLCRAVRGLAQLDHPGFEIVVVADGAGLAALAAAGLDGPLKLVRFDDANISAARNAGIEAAAGELVAFLDDDAVPEPTWLARLTAPFADPEVAAAGGFVRGRNGISYQWQGRLVAPDATETEIAPWGDAARVFPAAPGPAVKLQGTNMAFRRATLAALGGFDPALRFFLDETDLCLRLAVARHAVALVPLAEVHHGFAGGPHRTSDRVPRSLHEIGASLAVFLRKHLPTERRSSALARARAGERRRLVAHMVAGRIEPRDVARLLAGFEAGLAEGEARELEPLPPLAEPETDVRPYPALRRPMRRLAGRPWQAGRLRAAAARLVADGLPVTLFLFGPTARPHRLTFTETGWWEQRGGLFGRSTRDGARFRLTSFAARVARETRRLAAVRRFSDPPES